MRRFLLVALLAACGKREPPATTDPAHVLEPAKEFPSLEPFVDSRMWEILGQGKRRTKEVVADLGELEHVADKLRADGLLFTDPFAEDEPVAAGMPDARLKLPVSKRQKAIATMVPYMFAEMRPLWGRDEWSADETRLAREVTRLCTGLGAPDIAFGDDPAANQKGLALLAGWFRDFVATPAGMGSMIYTLDYGPFGGLPLPQDAAVEVTDGVSFGEFVFQLCRMNGDANEPWVLRARKDERVLWSRIASGAPDGLIPEVSLLKRAPTELGPYGWKVHLLAGGEYMQLYVARDGSFLFYFYSW